MQQRAMGTAIEFLVSQAAADNPVGTSADLILQNVPEEQLRSLVAADNFIEILAATVPERVASLGIIMSTTGKPFSSLPAWRVIRLAFDPPAKGASAELIGAALIGTAGFSGMPVSTTHIVTAGIAGTMAGDRGEQGGGLNKIMVWRIVTAWAVMIAVAAGLFYILA